MPIRTHKGPIMKATVVIEVADEVVGSIGEEEVVDVMEIIKIYPTDKDEIRKERGNYNMLPMR